MADLKVDLDGLASLASNLSRVVDWLEVEGGVLDATHDEVGDAGIVGALNDFHDHWHDGRKHVKDGAQALQQMAEAAVEAFCCTDHDLARQLCESVMKK